MRSQRSLLRTTLFLALAGISLLAINQHLYDRALVPVVWAESPSETDPVDPADPSDPSDGEGLGPGKETDDGVPLNIDDIINKDKDSDEELGSYDSEAEDAEPVDKGEVSKVDAEADFDKMSEEDVEALKKNAEPHRFQAEVERMMGIIINSLYTEKDVFLRELVSNAADALEKIRFLSVTDETSLGGNPDLEIRITFDKEAKTLTIADTGIGMTKQDLINNLGTVAKSGTSNFLEALAQGGDVNLVGQFGVGFYSAYLVADKVVVTSKNNNDKQYIWESTADAHFTVVEDPRGSTLGRGTRVTLHLKPDATDFATESKIRDCIKRYSQFIPHPIYLAVERKKKVPVEDTEDDDDKDKDEDEKEEKKEKKTKEVSYKKWELENEHKALWLRPIKEITQSEYDEFYKTISKDYVEPLAHNHFAAEGEVEFRAIVYIPKHAAADAWQQYFGTTTGMKLYVRRVLVSDSFDDLLPKYLHWVRGVVDSDDLPLKVDREQLAQNKVMKSISKKLVRKIIELIKKLSKDDEKQQLKEKEENKDKETPTKPETSKYDTFLKEFGRNLKLGCFEDEANRSKIVKVLRFYTLNTPKKQISIDQYLEDLGADAKEIFYMSSDSVESALASPLVKAFTKKGINVLLLVDPTDESCLSRLPDFEGKKLVSIQKGDLTLDDSSEAKKKLTKLNKMFAPLTTFFKSQLEGAVGKVAVSTRALEDPCVVVASQHGYSAYMEKVLKSQTFANLDQIKAMSGMKTMEINPSHPIIQDLLVKVKADSNDEKAKSVAKALYSAAIVAAGFELADGQASKISNYIYDSISSDIGVGSSLSDPDLEPDEEEDVDAEDLEVGDDDVKPEEVEEDDADDTEEETNEKETKEPVEESEEKEEKSEEAEDTVGDAKDEL